MSRILAILFFTLSVLTGAFDMQIGILTGIWSLFWAAGAVIKAIEKGGKA